MNLKQGDNPWPGQNVIFTWIFFKNKIVKNFLRTRPSEAENNKTSIALFAMLVLLAKLDFIKPWGSKGVDRSIFWGGFSKDFYFFALEPNLKTCVPIKENYNIKYVRHYRRRPATNTFEKHTFWLQISIVTKKMLFILFLK